MRRQQGFTLLEVLVAIAIFAVIGLGANQMLRTIIETHDRTTAKVQILSDLARAMAMLDRDLGQAVPRIVRDEFGDPMPPLMVASGQYYLELTRAGWNNPVNLPRSNLQRVAYDINDEGQLVRRFWFVMDRAEDSEPIEQVLLEGIEDFRVSMLVESGDSTDIWPDSDTGALLPLAVEVLIQSKTGGEIRKVYDIVDVFTPSSANNGVGSGGSDDDGDNEEQDDADELDAEIEDSDPDAESNTPTTNRGNRRQPGLNL